MARRRRQWTDSDRSRLAALGTKIQEARDEAGLTQEDLAVALGLSSNSPISQWENGHVNLDLLTLWQIEQALGLEVGQLLVRADLVARPDNARTAIEQDPRLGAETRELLLSDYDWAVRLPPISKRRGRGRPRRNSS